MKSDWLLTDDELGYVWVESPTNEDFEKRTCEAQANKVLSKVVELLKCRIKACFDEEKRLRDRGEDVNAFIFYEKAQELMRYSEELEGVQKDG